MEIGFRQRLTQKVEMKQLVSLQERLSIRLTLRLSIIQALRDTEYIPRGECPNCGDRLTQFEILEGFRQDPADFTTQCPRCKTRFEPKLFVNFIAGHGELPFLCAVQTTTQLARLQHLNPENLRKSTPGVYESALAHFGSLRHAFATMGIAYEHKENIGWENRILSFLGQVPDTLIAECAGVHVSKVRALRKSHGITAHKPW